MSKSDLEMSDWVNAALAEALLARQGHPPLYSAAQLGCLAAVRMMTSLGANLEIKGPVGRTAVHVASELGHVKIVAMLVNAGANVDAETDEGETPLILALLNNQVEVIELLLAAGATLMGHSKDGLSVLEILDHIEVSDNVRLLMELGGYEKKLIEDLGD